MVIKQSTLNPTTFFNFEGLEYQKNMYIITYGDIELDIQGFINKEKVTVGLRHKNNFSVVLASNTSIQNWSDGITNFTDLDALSGHIGSLISFNTGGGLGNGIVITQTVSTFSELSEGDSEGDLSYVESSQGTSWLPFSVGGTYYPAGWYTWSGTSWISDRNAIATQLETNILGLDGISGRVDLVEAELNSNVVRVKNSTQLINIDSTKFYLITEKIDLGVQQIEVPASGFFYGGYDYFVSCLFSSADNYTMFVNKSGERAGNLRATNVEHYVSGASSKLFELDNQGGFGAVEFNSCNLGRFASTTPMLGSLTSYRQFRMNDCAIFNISEGLSFSGTWAGGFKIADSILLSIPDGVTVFDEGTNLIFNGTSSSDLNAQGVNDGAFVFGFTENNFLLDEGFITAPTTRFNINSNPIPNADLTSIKFNFRGRGIKNTYQGGRWIITTQQITPLDAGVPTKLLGTTVYDDLVHFTNNGSNEFVYLSSIERDFVFTGQLTVSGGANDQIQIDVTRINFTDGTKTIIRSFTRNISNILGGLDIAIFDPYTPITLKQGDKVVVDIRNNTDGTDATGLEDSFVALNVRN